MLVALVREIRDREVEVEQVVKTVDSTQIQCCPGRCAPTIPGIVEDTDTSLADSQIVSIAGG